MRFTLRALALGTGTVALSACSLVNQRAASIDHREALPRPSLELLQADEVELAPQCVATESMQVSFTVGADGRTSNIQPSRGPACVQAAMVNWVTSFRYAPLAVGMPASEASVEWLLVSAKR